MKNLNKNLPIIVLRSIKEFFESLSGEKLFEIVDSKEYFLSLLDNDKDSGFYFRIEKFDESSGRLFINYKPQNSRTISSFRGLIEPQDLKSYFSVWNTCLKEYDELVNVSDPFLKNLEGEFYEKFDLSEETKNEPLKLNQIFYLEEILTKVETELGDYANENNKDEIAEIIEESSHLKSNLAKQSKEWVAKRFSTILAKITKEGPGILREIFKEVGKEFLSHGVKFLLEHGEKIIK